MFSRFAPPSERIYQGNRINFLILNRFDVETTLLDVPYVIVSVTDPERPEATIADSPNRRAVLRLKFHDKGSRHQISREKLVMSQEDAQAILAFVQEHLDKVKLIVCQCEAGISRSAAIAAALSRILQEEDHFFFANYAPNDWIYQTLLEAAQANGNGKV